MKRLDIEDQGDGFPILVEQADGRYVKYSDVEGLIAENKILREALEDLYSMASSPQWRNDPLYRICELIEKALEQSDVKKRT